MIRVIKDVVVFFLLISLINCGRSSISPPDSKERQIAKASVTSLTKTPLNIYYEAVGTIRSKTSSTIQSKATGHVLAVHVKEGDLVQPGQMLVEIDDREALSQIKRAENAVLEAQHIRQEVENSVQAAVQAKKAAEAGVALAQATYDRFKGMVDKQAVSRQAFDEASAKWKEATAEAAQAGEMLLSAQAKRAETDARIEQAKAELSTAQTILSFTKVTAPFAGIVTSKTVDVGDLAAPGAPLLQIENTQQYRLESLVDEALVQKVKQGDKVPVILDALGSRELSGIVAEIVPSAESASRSFVVKIDLPQTPTVKSGMYGRARFAMGEKEGLTVPASSIVQRGQLSGVYVVGRDNVARLQLITTGKRYGEQVEVLSGLDPGVKIVVDNIGQVTDGCIIQ